jgi:hypothetical protein
MGQKWRAPFSYANTKEMPMSETAQPSGVPNKEELKKAFKAFKRRLKLTRLDEESTLGGKHVSSGRSSAVVAITPPHEFPPEIWEELVRQGRLKRAGHGMYELVEPL